MFVDITSMVAVCSCEAVAICCTTRLDKIGHGALKCSLQIGGPDLVGGACGKEIREVAAHRRKSVDADGGQGNYYQDDKRYIQSEFRFYGHNAKYLTVLNRRIA